MTMSIPGRSWPWRKARRAGAQAAGGTGAGDVFDVKVEVTGGGLWRTGGGRRRVGGRRRGWRLFGGNRRRQRRAGR